MINDFLPLKEIKLDRISVVFTWDDNFSSHKNLIGPLFYKYGLKCSFYINPGTKDFSVKYAHNYYDLAINNFEIASHGNTHKYMASLSKADFERELKLSIQGIIQNIGFRPLTFAFPHHDYNNEKIKLAGKYFIQTRNNLQNSKRFSIKTKTKCLEMINALKNAIDRGHNLIYSGHSIILKDEKNTKEEGYEPAQYEEISEFIRNISYFEKEINILTFVQAALKEIIRNNAIITNKGCLFKLSFLKWLEKAGIEIELIKLLI